MQSAKPSEVSSPNIFSNAIFHLSFQLIRRNDSRTAIAKAAYNSADVLTTSGGTYTWNYKAKSNVLYSKIIGPACMPLEFYNRNVLWIAACRAEKRINSNEAREIAAAIPYPFTLLLAQKLCLEFALELVEKHQVAVDFNIHAENRVAWDGSKKNQGGMHVHFLMTTRRITAEGIGEKTRELDIRTNHLVKYWRVRWQDLVNRYLEELGSTARVSCLSNKDRDIAKEASIRLGPAQTAMERRGKRTLFGDYNRMIASHSEQSE